MVLFLLFVCLFSVVACQALASSVPGPSNAVKKQTASLPVTLSEDDYRRDYGDELPV